MKENSLVFTSAQVTSDQDFVADFLAVFFDPGPLAFFWHTIKQAQE